MLLLPVSTRWFVRFVLAILYVVGFTAAASAQSTAVITDSEDRVFNSEDYLGWLDGSAEAAEHQQ
jgi:hypothetical protein